MKKTLLLGLIVFVSISNINADNTTYSNEIQDTFFGIKFGESKEVVKANLLRKGFEIRSEGLDDMVVEHDENIRFGGYTWEIMMVTFVNNRFNSINFAMTLDRNPKLKLTIEEETGIFLTILLDLSKKYNMSITDAKGVISYRADSEQKYVALGWFVEKKLIVLNYSNKTLGNNSDQF